MTVKIKVNRKTHEIEKIIGNIGHTAQNMAGAKLFQHEVEPTFGYKMRRFVKRLCNEISYHADVLYGSVLREESATVIPYIGIESCIRGGECND